MVLLIYIVQWFQQLGFQHTELTDVVSDCTVDDAGDYKLLLANAGGTAETSVNVVVFDKPGAPIGPVQFDKITADSIVLSWNPPVNNCGVEVSGYIVEKREAGSTVCIMTNLRH